MREPDDHEDRTLEAGLTSLTRGQREEQMERANRRLIADPRFPEIAPDDDLRRPRAED